MQIYTKPLISFIKDKPAATAQSAKVLFNKMNTFTNAKKFNTPTSTRIRVNPNVKSVSNLVTSMKRNNTPGGINTPVFSRLAASTTTRLVNSANPSTYRVTGATATAAKTPISLVRDLNDPIRLSRTVECAKKSIRRSIKTLNGALNLDDESSTPSTSKTKFRRSTFRK